MATTQVTTTPLMLVTENQPPAPIPTHTTTTTTASTSNVTLDDLELLASSQPVKTLLKDRLYVGNLHPTVDEYSLLHVFSKFGKVTKLGFLFHKSGPMKGKPRAMSQKALSVAHGKLLRGRKLVVTYAQQAPFDQYPGGGGTYGRRPMVETGRPTTLSLIKTGLAQRTYKIRLMEAKLLQLSGTPRLPQKPQTTVTAGAATPSMLPSLPHKPSQASLPLKPASGTIGSGSRPSSLGRPGGGTGKGLLPNLPLPAKPTGVSATTPPVAVKPAKPKLAGGG
ncbi:hypothetical protein BKA70DRAFT_1378943 [Coprinopsis sp. MPI-PUGE-AT-0042]|nr:hypothetical protein BKA70DRAFT_1378943 [Coprinopsis sp. MPI-PUGE-AT-0042]